MFEQKRKQLMICLVFAVMLSGFFLLRYLPLKSRTKALQIRRQTAQQAISQALIKSEALPHLKEQLKELSQTVENYDKQIPGKRDLGEFLQQIAGLMNEHNLKEQMIEPRIEVESEKFNCIPVGLKCKGRIRQISEFYKSLQALDRFVRIEDFNLANERNLGGEVSMQTKGVIYYRPKAEQG